MWHVKFGNSQLKARAVALEASKWLFAASMLFVAQGILADSGDPNIPDVPVISAPPPLPTPPPPPPARSDLDETCTVSILNRTARVNPDGTFAVPNVPAAPQVVRASVICVRDVLLGGQSDFFQISEGSTVELLGIVLGPIPPTVESFTTTLDIETLIANGATSQLAVLATLSDGSERDISTAIGGTIYTSSNANIATVSVDGLITAANQSGIAFVSITNNGVFASKRVSVTLGNDADFDGLPDDYELLFGLDPNDPADAASDLDGDGLSALDEFNLGTLPDNPDTDGDGLSDGQEVIFGSSPFSPDSDLDGVLDGNEPNPTADFDGDGIPNILDSDSDNDGLNDGVEVSLVGNTTAADPNADNDGDGLVNIDEVALSTDPNNPDTDGDGISDGQEVLANTDPLVPETTPPAVVVLNPANFETFTEGQTLTVRIDATDNGVISTVELILDGISIASDSTAPYDFPFTIPFNTILSTIEVSAIATDVAGNIGASEEISFSIVPDLLTTVEGTVLDANGTLLESADVSLAFKGLKAEFFDFTQPLTDFPDLNGLIPDITRAVSSLNIINPGGLLSQDPFGVNLAPDFAARFTGDIQIPVIGSHTFTLGTDAQARLFIDDIQVIEVMGGGQMIEESGLISLERGPHSVRVEYFQGFGNGELRLTVVKPGNNPDSPEVVATDISADANLFTAVTDAAGAFQITGVPTNLGDIVANGSFVLSDGTVLGGQADPVPPIANGITDVGQIVVGAVKIIDFSQFADCGNFGSSSCQNRDVGELVGESVLFSGTQGFSGASLYNSTFSLGSNSGWNSDRNGYVGINSSSASIFAEFEFAQGVSDVEAFVSYAPNNGLPVIEIYDVNHALLDSFIISEVDPISTSILNDGAFRGFSRASNDIFFIRFSGGFQVIDDLTFSRGTSIP